MLAKKFFTNQKQGMKKFTSSVLLAGLALAVISCSEAEKKEAIEREEAKMQETYDALLGEEQAKRAEEKRLERRAAEKAEQEKIRKFLTGE